MKQTLLFILLLYSCEAIDTAEIIPQGEDAHNFIVENITAETKTYWKSFVNFTDHANVLYKKQCSEIPFSNSDVEILEELRGETYVYLLVVVDVLYSLEGLVDSGILTLYMEHYENDEVFILNLLKD